MELVEVAKAEKGELPFSKNSIYKFHSLKKHPNMILKIGGKLYFDLEEWRKEAELVRKKTFLKLS